MSAAPAPPPAVAVAAAAVSTLPSRVSLSPDFTHSSSASSLSSDNNNYRENDEEKKDEEVLAKDVADVAKLAPAAIRNANAAAAPMKNIGNIAAASAERIKSDAVASNSVAMSPNSYAASTGKVPAANGLDAVTSGVEAVTNNDIAVHNPLPAQSKKKKPDTSSPRRTGRKRTSTTMIIGGQVVKRANNYVVTGDNYTFGAFKADEVKPNKFMRVKKPEDDGEHPKPTQPRKRPAYMEERARHNEAIRKKLLGEDDENRLGFMASNLEALEPFVDEKVKARLLAARNRMAVGAPGKKGRVLGAQPDAVVTTLRDYQMIGLDWMAKMHSRGMPFILGDEMGLGKTLQTIALICHLKENYPDFKGPSLVICPLSVLYSWCAEVEKHAPSLRHFRFHASDNKERAVQKDEMLKDALKYDIIITTYEMAKNPLLTNLISGTYFQLCVLDEGHVIKSLTSQIGVAVRRIHSRGRVILSGTPLQNNLVELYAILNYLYPQYFTTPDRFESAFNITLNQIDPDMLLKANKLLKLFMIRRLKDEVERLMPKKIETKILCPLSSSQVFWYKGFLMNEIETLVRLTEAGDGDEEAGRSKHLMLRNLIMQLRKVCLHPYLYDFAESDAKSTSVEELVASSGKLAVLDKLLRSLFNNGHRACIFSQFTAMLNILEDYCALRGWRYCRFDGGTPRAQRNHIINQFNAPGSDVFVFLMSTRSGGLGINLQTADTCILYDSDWNPQPDLQAMARVHRIGQTKTVHVYRMISAGTVEERIVERAEKKLYLDQMVNRGTSNRDMDEDGAGLTTSELLASLRFGSNAVFSSSNDLPTDADIEKVTDRNRSEESSDGILEGGIAKTAVDFEKDKELTDTRQFCGVDFRKLREEKEGKLKGQSRNKFLDKLKQDWKEVQPGESLEEMGKGKRNRKSRLLQVESKGSGWGSSHVPVLAMNDYELSQGEPSSWGRETKKVISVPQKKRAVEKFSNQDFCQVCGDGGMLIECPRCPISVHSNCCGLKTHEFQCCTHHNCVLCEKSAAGAGGLIYRCQSCPNAYCPDCLEGEPHRYLGTNVPRFEKLGFEGNPLYFYVHCSEQCETVAKAEFGYKLEYSKPRLPPCMNVSYAFGKDAMDMKDMAKMFKVKANGVCEGDRKKSPKKSPPCVAGSRVSPRKRSPTPKAAAAAGMVFSLAPQHHEGQEVIDLINSPPLSGDSKAVTGYI